ncbi:multidrug resistance-associated protein 4-like isoform X2 [Belonocnema kinseyi]|uniref:multidrug resistance-associated protein 4-like isoform X2 n=1 Tax=Belonocnema kinseyi TaxID=2817044 RepID=UPI00143D40B2|nr:multidrug resistance-associated protein 4-like isoform X2 [Belonocnema kinseyi]
MDNKERQQQENNPEEGASFLSILSFAQTLGNLISKIWNEEEEKCKEENLRKPSLLRVLLRCFGKELIVMGLLQGFNELFIRIFQVVLFSKILQCLNDTEVYYWASGFAVCLILSCFMECLSNQSVTKMEMKFKISCSALIYRKCLKLTRSSVENSDVTVGQVVNVLSNDINNFHDSFFGFHYLWIAPIQVAIITIILYQKLNISCFAGTLIIFLLILLQGHIGKWIKHLTYKLSLRTDKRVSLMEEIVSGVQVIKMYAWEKSFADLVDKARAKEINVIRKISFIDALTVCLDVYTPRLCIFAIVLLYVLFENHISVEQVYLVTAFYTTIRFSVNICMTLGMQRLAKCLVSIKRIQELLMRNEIQHSITTNFDKKNIDHNNAIQIYKAFAKWSPDNKKSTIQNISLIVQRGSLSAIIGQVGAGKSSLLQLLLNELPLESGSIQVSGRIVYVIQEPWVFASSIRQNILFGLPMNKKRYQEVIKVCQLEQDFSIFPFGDKTFIGEKGMTLSGGQKARINLARAVYVDADTYLFDDPLSAVDNYVSRRIFKECICEYLKEKTRILVTHQVQYLESMDRIYILNNGLMEMEGSYTELSHTSELDWAKVLPLKDNDNNHNDNDGDEINKKMKTTDREDRLKLLRRNSEDPDPEEIPEHRTVGKTSGTVYMSYFKAAGSIWILLLVILLGVLCQIVATSGDIFLARWVNTEHERGNGTLSSSSDNMWYIQIYTLLSLTAIILMHAYYLVFCEMCMRSSQNLHKHMFFSVMRTTMSFFHDNPFGRILNRFSKDIGTVDRGMLLIMIYVAQSCLQLASVVVINTSVNPWLLIPTVIVGSVFYLMRSVYMKTSSSLKRLEAIHRSPIFSHVSATLQGLTTIRALKVEKILIQEFDNYQNLHSSAWYLFCSCVSAFLIYLKFVSYLYITLVLYLLVSVRYNISSGDVGLIITQCILLSEMLVWGIKETTELEIQMTSVERILEYSDLEQEALLETKPEQKLSAQWPSEGRVEFKDISLSYKPSGALVLKNLNFLVLPKEKIGIVGRTGAGKSSLIAALYRLAYMRGEIYIDGVATGDLGLHDVRSNLSIIPQEPLLFAGSLRRNLDPFNNYSDDELWQALSEVELKSFIMDLHAGLDSKVSDGGSNFSVGQRQLLCLARAIVRKNKILILDEATANVDSQTDKLIQKTIRRRFEGCTVFIIAHRLNTVMDCDKFIVMDSGFMVEFGHPYELLRKKEGYLYKMVCQSGPIMADILTKMAENTCR